MQHREGNCDGEHQWRQVFRLHNSLCHGVIAIEAGVAEELAALLLLLTGRLDDFDAAHGFVQPGVQHAELHAHLIGNGVQPLHIDDNGDHEADQENRRNQQQANIEDRDEDERHHQRRHRIDDQIDAR